ncbi:MAG: methylamine methyltransferase corrinoid protein reductive activase [Thermoleophilia bacterium]|nr:methylamine methyltransferase corrinoid protein reductive activase [Thermoleophilia bacterium]
MTTKDGTGRLGIALDLGTSGIRGQAIDLSTGQIVSTAITTQHPLPGGNVMDHLHFAVETSTDGMSGVAHDLMVDTANKVIRALGVDLARVDRLAICGNPIQLSLFQGMEIRDLAYAGRHKRESLGVEIQPRDARVGLVAEIAGLDLPAEAALIVPPAVAHEIGADALAMMVKSSMLDRDEIALVTDYGTNAEMALKVGDSIVTGSAACGPAFEGQAIAFGMLAAPGAISDLVREDGVYRSLVLDEDMMPQPGQLVDPRTGEVRDEGTIAARGITGTGVMAVIALGLEDGLLKLPGIDSPDGRLHLANGVVLTKDDVGEVGKAIGAARAGHLTLAAELGIDVEDIKVAYMAGASGTYVDAHKAQSIGMAPASATTLIQIGNTSLMMARDLVLDPERLRQVEKIARELRARHSMFAEAPVFKQAYVLELAYWTEGMPWEMYLKFIKKMGLPPLREFPEEADVRRWVERDIPDFGLEGLRVVHDVGMVMVAAMEGCTECSTCKDVCPEDAVSITHDEQGRPLVEVESARCLGLSCLRCQISCPERVFQFSKFLRAR